MNTSPHLSQPQSSHSSIPTSQQYQSHMDHQTSYVLPIAYHSPQASTQPMTEFPQIDSGLAVHVFTQGDDPITYLNKAMAFLSSVAASRFPSTINQLRTSSNTRNQDTIQDDRVTVQQVQGRQGQSYAGTGYKGNATCFGELMQEGRQGLLNVIIVKEKAMLAEAQESGQILDEEQLAFFADLGIPDGQATQTTIPNIVAFQTADLDAYDSDCDDVSNAKARLMANLSNYSLDVILEEPHFEPYHNDKANQIVHAMQGFEQTPVVDFTDNEITKQMINHVSNWEKANQENNNESLTAELERYKERVKTFAQRLNIDLSTREKMIDSQIDDMIKEKLALKKQIDSLEQIFSNKIKEKESLLQTFIVFKNESKEKESKYMDKEIDLETKIMELDNSVYKVGQSTQTVHMLRKPQDGSVISSQHVVIPVIDDEETLILEEISQSKMLAKQNDPISKEKKINTTPINYVELNQLSKHFGKHFVPQQELSVEQAFWLQTSHLNTDKFDISPVKIKAPRELPKVESSKTPDSNTLVFPSIGLKSSTSASISQPTGNKKNHAKDHICDENVEHTMLNVNSELIRVKCKQCMFDANHDVCFLDFVNDVNVRSKSKSAKQSQQQNIWKSMGKVFTIVGYKWKPTGKLFTLVGNSCPLTRFTLANLVPPKETTSHSVETQKPEIKDHNRRPKQVKSVGSSKKSKIIESKIANNSEPNHSWRSNATDVPSSSSSLVNDRNDQIAKIMGYGDYQLGNVTISRVYYVEGLGHNLFSVRQFCDSDLEVAFQKNTCFIRNLDGVDLLSGSRDTNLYTISLDDMLNTSLICLLSNASKTKSWLWHRRLSHLKFGTLNKLTKDGLARGIPKLKLKKDHLCSTCALGKRNKPSHKPKAKYSNKKKLYLLHMDVYGSMRVESINGKKYILVIVDDYSRFTWVKYLRSTDEAPNTIIKCIKNIQVRLNATVRNVRTDNRTEFVNQTIREFYENVGIFHQTSVAGTPQ
ncbi:integrase, catalytic region, zinc finger, CCHC-type containing protein [Tanacetum coccineum]